MVTRASTPNLFSSDIIYFRRAVHFQDSLVQQTVMNSLWDGMLTKILELKTLARMFLSFLFSEPEVLAGTRERELGEKTEVGSGAELFLPLVQSNVSIIPKQTSRPITLRTPIVIRQCT
jgi:hypothetical protein